MSETVYGKIDNYLIDLFNLQDEALQETEASIIENGMPEHSISPVQGQLLQMLAQMCNAKIIVEVGTLGGYSTIWLSRAVEEQNGRVITIEEIPDYSEVASKNIENAGLTNVVEIITGNGIEVLNQLDLGEKPVDLFFMDADKPNYVNYFNWALKHSRSGSLIIADNVIREGNILDENSADDKVLGVRDYLEMIANNQSVVTSVIQQVGLKGHDGIAISMVK